MKFIRTFIFIFLLFFNFQSLLADTYPGVIFENSILSGNYSGSEAFFSGNSWIHHIHGHLPVSDSVFFTPNNALLLQYISAPQGNWNADIHFAPGKDYTARPDEVLSFKLFVQSKTQLSELPMIQLKQDTILSSAMSIQQYIDSYQENMWFSVDIPLKDIPGFQPGVPVQTIVFTQGATDGREHELFVDQIEFIPAAPPQAKLTGQAVLSSADAYERHVNLTWQLPLTPSIRYIKIYRSSDHETFQPVAIRPVYYRKYTDMIPASGQTYYYKIAWVDYQYRESPFSEVMKADTRTMNNEELLNVIEAAHINYFVEGFEINSGMHRVSNAPGNATVSVQNTGAGILALIAGVERKGITREALLKRLLKITDFLAKADRFYGAWPAYLDGRTGKAVPIKTGRAEASLDATSYLIQGLLCARQYFNKEEAGETDLRAKITALWRAVDWQGFTVTRNGRYLFDTWSPVTEWKYSSPVSGYNSGFISYLLAIASPAHPISAASYQEAYMKPLKLIETSSDGEQEGIKPFSEKNHSGIPVNLLKGRNRVSEKNAEPDTVMLDSLSEKINTYAFDRFVTDSVYFGARLKVGKVSQPLTAALSLYMAFDPRNKRDLLCNYFDNMTDLATIHYRQDAARGTSPASLSQDVWGYNEPDSTAVGMIQPAAAVASYPYTPSLSLKAISKYYRGFGDFLFTEYGFRNAFNLNENWVEDDYLAMNQALIAVNLENARSGLIWKLFMQDEDIKKAVGNLFTE